MAENKAEQLAKLFNKKLGEVFTIRYNLLGYVPMLARGVFTMNGFEFIDLQENSQTLKYEHYRAFTQLLKCEAEIVDDKNLEMKV